MSDEGETTRDPAPESAALKLAEAIADGLVQASDQMLVWYPDLEECINAAADGRRLDPDTIQRARRALEQMMTLPRMLEFQRLKQGRPPKGG